MLVRAGPMGQKWGKPCANLCHLMPIMHLRKRGGGRRQGAQSLDYSPRPTSYSYTIGVWIALSTKNGNVKKMPALEFF